jgi:hypothetical protein
LEVTILKRFGFLSLSLLLLILIPGCITVQMPTSATTPLVGTPPVIIVFSSNPSVIDPGGKPTLLWSVAGANSVSIDQGIGQVDVAGTRLISPVSSTVYTISATNSAGTVTRTTVTKVNSTSPLQVYPQSLTQGTFIIAGIIPGESGSIIKNGQDYTRSTAVCVGDTGSNLASRAFLSFNISSIPGNAIIDEVSLNLGGFTETGNPTYTDPVNGPQYGNFGALSIERYQYGSFEDLDTYAYNRPGELVASGEITSYPLSPWNLAIKDPDSGNLSVQGLVIAGQTRFQLRSQFFTSTNWNGVRDMLCFDQAMLKVKYHLP